MKVKTASWLAGSICVLVMYIMFVSYSGDEEVDIVKHKLQLMQANINVEIEKNRKLESKIIHLEDENIELTAKMRQFEGSAKKYVVSILILPIITFASDNILITSG